METREISAKLEEVLKLIKSKKYEEAELLVNGVIYVLDEQNSFENAPFLSEAYNHLGQVLYKKVEFDKAVTCYSKAISIDSQMSTPYYNRGTIYYRLGLYEVALKDLKEATRLEPQNMEFSTALRATQEALELNTVQNGQLNTNVGTL